MRKLIAAAGVSGAGALLALGLSSPAQAYPDTPPSQGAPQANSGALPSTGGPDAWLALGGAGLIVAGAAAVGVSRRRQSAE
jgi:LPXTG-motif cell wall-anchored protein